MLLFEKEPYYQPKHKLITTSRPMGTLLIVVLREGCISQESCGILKQHTAGCCML